MPGIESSRIDQTTKLKGGANLVLPTFVFVFGLMCTNIAVAQGVADGVALTTDEATAFVKGKSLSAVRLAGGTPHIQFKDDGAMYGSNAGSDSGKWRIEDGKLCMAWRRWEYEGCGKLVRVGEEIKHLYPDGASVHLVFKK